MVARYVVPEINGYLDGLRKSQKFLIENRAVFERAKQAVMAKNYGERQGRRRAFAPMINAPGLQKEAAKQQKA